MKRVLPCTVIIVVVLLAYRKITRLWWMFDDPAQLHLLRDVSLTTLLNGRQFYGGASVFTPLLVLSLKVDQSLFGIDSVPYYVHQLISVTLAMLAGYALLRMWSSVVASTAAVLATLFGTPLVYTAPLLMCRHYIEGALFAFVAMIAFVYALRERHIGAAAVSAVAYFLAACAKEIYVPLPALLLVLPEGDRRQRIRYSIPHALALAVYAMWRIAAVGFDVEPYGFLAPPSERRMDILSMPWRMLRNFASAAPPASNATLIAALAAVIVALVRCKRTRLLIALALLMAFLPVVPLATSLEQRYALALWLVCTTCVAFLPRGLAVAVAVLAFLSFRVQWPQNYRDLMRMSDEARVLTLLGPGDVVYKPLTSPTTVLELRQLTGTQAIGVYDELPFCDQARHIGRIFQYDTPRREMREITREPVDRACATIVTKPMSVDIRFDPSRAFWWRLGPYTQGRWTFILADGVVAYDVEDHGGFRRPGWDNFTLRVRYIAPEGWRTYSGALRVDGTKPLVEFRR